MQTWEFCEPDPGTVARDHLAELTRGLTLECRPVGGKRVRCTAGGRDLSCAMIGDGAAAAVAKLDDCPPAPPPHEAVSLDFNIPIWMVAAVLAALNAIALIVMAFDQYRARRGFRGVPDRLLLLIAMLGGAPGLLAGQLLFRVDPDKQASIIPVFAILGLQIGAGLGILLM